MTKAEQLEAEPIDWTLILLESFRQECPRATLLVQGGIPSNLIWNIALELAVNCGQKGATGVCVSYSPGRLLVFDNYEHDPADLKTSLGRLKKRRPESTKGHEFPAGVSVSKFILKERGGRLRYVKNKRGGSRIMALATWDPNFWKVETDEFPGKRIIPTFPISS